MVSDTRDPADTSEPRRPRAVARVGVAAVVASFVGIWGYVLYLSVVEGRAEPRDRLTDTTWTAAAEETCADATEVIGELEFASEVSSPAERADLLDAATDELDRMVDRLGGLVPPGPSDEARAVAAWQADWRTYLEDRRAYADRFRAGLDEPFRVTDRGGFQIDVLIDDFAHVNYMDNCRTPDDVG